MKQVLKALGAVVLAAAMFGGCGSGAGGDVEPVTGQPVAGLSVTFIACSGRPGTGVTDAQGRFQLATIKPNGGALVGDHKVSVSEGTGSEPPGRPGTREAAKAGETTQTVQSKYN